MRALLAANAVLCAERTDVDATTQLQPIVPLVRSNLDDSVWDVTVFTKDHERLLDADIAKAFFQGMRQQAREWNLLSAEYLTVMERC